MAFDWTISVGNIIAFGAMAVSIIFGLRTARKSKKAQDIQLSLVYIDLNNLKVETLRIINASNHTINIDRLGVIVKNNIFSKQGISFSSNGFWIKELPLTLSSEQTETIEECTDSYIYEAKIPFHEVFQGIFVERKNPLLKRCRPNSKIYLFAEDNLGKIHKTYIGLKKDIIYTSFSDQFNISILRERSAEVR